VEPLPQPTAVNDVDQLTAYIAQLASGKHIGIVPEIPFWNNGDNFLVALNGNDLSAAKFCELASIAGARLLYVRAKNFDTASDPDLDIGKLGRLSPGREAHTQLAALYRDAERFNGRIRELELAFVANCVLHSWSVAAGWYDNLLERAAMLPDDDLDTEFPSATDWGSA
jgi:hypothetical protein